MSTRCDPGGRGVDQRQEDGEEQQRRPEVPLDDDDPEGDGPHRDHRREVRQRRQAQGPEPGVLLDEQRPVLREVAREEDTRMTFRSSDGWPLIGPIVSRVKRCPFTPTQTKVSTAARPRPPPTCTCSLSQLSERTTMPSAVAIAMAMTSHSSWTWARPSVARRGPASRGPAGAAASGAARCRRADRRPAAAPGRSGDRPAPMRDARRRARGGRSRGPGAPRPSDARPSWPSEMLPTTSAMATTHEEAGLRPPRPRTDLAEESWQVDAGGRAGSPRSHGAPADHVGRARSSRSRTCPIAISSPKPSGCDRGDGSPVDTCRSCRRGPRRTSSDRDR